MTPRLPYSGKIIELKICPKLTFSEELRCGGCKKFACELKSALKLCNRCKIAYYCSKECQIKNHKEHKNDCKTVGEKSYQMEFALSKLFIAESTQNSNIVMQVQSDLTKLLNSCPLKEMTLAVVTIKTIFYLFLDNFMLASGMLNIGLMFVEGSNAPECLAFKDKQKGHVAHSMVSRLEKGDGKMENEEEIEEWLMSSDKLRNLIEEIEQEQIELGIPEDTTFPFLRDLLEFEWKSADTVHLKNMRDRAGLSCEFASLLVDADVPEVLKNAPLHLLVVFLAFQLKSKNEYGDERFLTQRLEVNQVIKTIALRNSKILKFLANPDSTEETNNYFFHLEDKNDTKWFENSPETFGIFKVLNFKYLGLLFNNIPGARKYILQYLYPGAEIVQEKI